MRDSLTDLDDQSGPAPGTLAVPGRQAGSSAEQPLRGLGSVYKRGRIWWIAYWWRGEKIRESSRSIKKQDAIKLLKRRIQEIGKGRFIDPKAEERVRMEDLFETVITDYENNRKRSLATLKARLIPLRAAFGLDRAIDVDEARIERYKQQRLAAKRRGDKLVAPATVNRELACLRRAFRLGVKQKRISRVPDIQMLQEAPPREGFIEPNQFAALVARLPLYLQDVARFAYIVGWRKGALRGLRWADVDRENNRLYLRRSGSKNKKPYVIVLKDELAAIIERRWDARKVTTPDGTSILCEFVFHQGDARPIGDFRKAWATACEDVGMPGLLFHDFRRSAARNLRRAGIGPDVGMRITGHETDSMWRRYSVVKEDDIEQALQVAQRYIRERTAVKKERTVIAMPEIHR